MNSRRYVGAVLVAATLLLLAPFASAAIAACDNFGQDWQITLGPFGGSFPGTQLVSGCRDCDGSLGCGGPLPLDGALVRAAGGSIFSTTSYRPVGSASCVSTHWTGLVKNQNSISGNVSNENGPFGTFVITAGNCTANMPAMADPTQGTRPAWEFPK